MSTAKKASAVKKSNNAASSDKSTKKSPAAKGALKASPTAAKQTAGKSVLAAKSLTRPFSYKVPASGPLTLDEAR